jgi:hypothetical protein
MNDQFLLMESNFTENNTKQAFREVKFYKKGFKPRTDLCEDKQGTIISDNAAIKIDGRNIFNNFYDQR